MPDVDKVRLGSGVASPGGRRLVLGSPTHTATPAVSLPAAVYAVRARSLDNGASSSPTPVRSSLRTRLAVPEAKTKPGYAARQVSGASRPQGGISSSRSPFTPRSQAVTKPSYAQVASGKASPGRQVISRMSASDDAREKSLLIAAAAANSLPQPAIPGLNPEADPEVMQDLCQSGSTTDGHAEVGAGSESDVAARAGGPFAETTPMSIVSSPTVTPPVSPSPGWVSETTDLPSQPAEWSGNSYRSFIVSPSTAGSASTDNTRNRGDDIAAAIAAARVAASRGLTEQRNMSNDPTLDAGKSRDLKGQRELYADCVNLRWQLFAQDAAREDGSGDSAPVGVDSLAPRVASFAAQLLWEHDRAVLEAERCNAWAAEARVEAEKTESRLEETLAMQDTGKVGQEALLRGNGTASATSSVLEWAQQTEINCTEELAAALRRCERVEASLNECEVGNALASASLHNTEDALQRESGAFSFVSSCMERLEAEMASECEVVHTLQAELLLVGESELTVASQHEKIQSLSSEVDRMTELSERQLSELLLLRTSEQSAPFSSRSQLERSLGDRICSAASSQVQVERIVGDQVRIAASESLEEGPREPSKKTHAALEEEVTGLQALVQQLAEELGNMHTAHSDVINENDQMLSEKEKLASQFAEAKAVNQVLAEQFVKLRLSTGIEPSQACEVSQGSSTPVKAGHTSPSASTAKPHSQLLSEALTRENRRLRVATGTVEGAGSLGSWAETPPGDSQR